MLPQEADIVRKIYDLFIETDSLTAVDAGLLQQHIVTKTGRKFTRFSIKNILQNPVYMIADEDAYRYFSERQADIFSDIKSFDGVHGILAYNRTNQKKGRAANTFVETYADRPVIAISMGWLGGISRIAGEFFGSALTFGVATKASAPGQMSARDVSYILDLLHSKNSL